MNPIPDLGIVRRGRDGDLTILTGSSPGVGLDSEGNESYGPNSQWLKLETPCLSGRRKGRLGAVVGTYPVRRQE